MQIGRAADVKSVVRVADVKVRVLLSPMKSWKLISITYALVAQLVE